MLALQGEEFFPAEREYLHSVYGSYVCGYVEGYTEENDEEGVEDVRVGKFLETRFGNFKYSIVSCQYLLCSPVRTVHFVEHAPHQ